MNTAAHQTLVQTLIREREQVMGRKRVERKTYIAQRRKSKGKENSGIMQ